MDLPAVVIMAAAPQGSWQLESTHRKKPCFDAESGPNPFGHTRALESPFFDPKLKQGSKPWTEESHIYIYIYIYQHISRPARTGAFTSRGVEIQSHNIN